MRLIIAYRFQGEYWLRHIWQFQWGFFHHGMECAHRFWDLWISWRGQNRWCKRSVVSCRYQSKSYRAWCLCEGSDGSVRIQFFKAIIKFVSFKEYSTKERGYSNMPNDATYHLIGQHQNSLKREFSLAIVEQVFKTGSKQVDNHHIVVSFHTKPVHVWNSDWR